MYRDNFTAPIITKRTESYLFTTQLCSAPRIHHHRSSSAAPLMVSSVTEDSLDDELINTLHPEVAGTRTGPGRVV